MTSKRGFSLLELLAATVIFGVLLTVVLAPLSNLFRRTAENSRTLESTTEAQRVLEGVKGQWRALPTPSSADPAERVANNLARDLARNLYDRSCFPDVTVPAGTEVVIRAVDRDGNAGAALGCTDVSPALSEVPVMKRITVTVLRGDEETVLSVDVPRPPANDPAAAL